MFFESRGGGEKGGGRRGRGKKNIREGGREREKKRGRHLAHRLGLISPPLCSYPTSKGKGKGRKKERKGGRKKKPKR